jgi:hypothetical protein
VVKQGVAKKWPFRSVAYPGRGLSWDGYQKLPDE